MQQQNFNFTTNQAPEVQKQACDVDSSVFLFANAGTGKTKTLCDRFLGHIVFGGDAKKILCLTYTNAAAEEMKERILALASEWSQLSESQLRAELLKRYPRQIDLQTIERAKNAYTLIISAFSDLKIQTLHAFCSSLLSRFREYHPSEKKFDIVSNSLIKKLRREGVDYALSNCEPDELVSMSRYYTLSEIRERLESLLGSSANLKRFFELSPLSNINTLYFSLFALEEFKSLEEIESEILAVSDVYLRHIEARYPKLFQAVSTSRNSIESIKEIYFTKTGELRKAITSLNDPFIDDEVFRIDALIQKMKQVVSCNINIFFLNLARVALEKINELKAKKQVLEFDDLLLSTHKLLHSNSNAENILYKLDFEIDQILVDEAQDLSSQQWDIINLLSGEFFSGIGARDITRNIFVVGDFKQSIYSFQGAEPSVFLKMCDFYYEKCQGINRNFLKLEMTKSFRTTKTVLGLVDKIFENDSQLRSAHTFARDGEGRACVYPLIQKEKLEENGWKLPSNCVHEFDSEAVLAKKIANEVKSWIDQKRLISGRERSVEPKDIFILFRKRSQLMILVAKELRINGIEVNSQVKVSLKDTLLFLDFKSLLNFIIDPHDDFNLAGLLKSPFFNLLDKDLERLTSLNGRNLLEKVSLVMPNIYDDLIHFIKLSQQKSVSDFFILAIKNNYEKFLKRFGQSAESLMEAIITSIGNLAEEGMTFLELSAEFENCDIEVQPSNNSSNSISLMTAHSSKGLQAPVVILADSASSANSPYDDIIWFKKIPVIIPPKKFNESFVTKLKEINSKKQKEESERLLYVALTRAEDEIHAFGLENRSQEKSWFSKIEMFSEMQNFSENNIEELRSESSFHYYYGNNTNNNEDEFVFSSNLEFSSEKTLRGELCHYLLEIISYDVPILELEKFAFVFTQKLEDEGVKDCIKKVLIIYEKYKWIFAEESLAEVAFHNNHGQEIRIDRLIIKNDKVIVIDFKSDEIVPNSIEYLRGDYLKQLSEYSEVVKKVYGKPVESYIIWLENASIMKL